MKQKSIYRLHQFINLKIIYSLEIETTEFSIKESLVLYTIMTTITQTLLDPTFIFLFRYNFKIKFEAITQLLFFSTSASHLMYFFHFSLSTLPFVAFLFHSPFLMEFLPSKSKSL